MVRFESWYKQMEIHDRNVNVHEARAIEYTGHKVLTVPSHEGKMITESWS